jgi:hypothetical protein
MLDLLLMMRWYSTSCNNAEINQSLKDFSLGSSNIKLMIFPSHSSMNSIQQMSYNCKFVATLMSCYIWTSLFNVSNYLTLILEHCLLSRPSLSSTMLEDHLLVGPSSKLHIKDMHKDLYVFVIMCRESLPLGSWATQISPLYTRILQELWNG